MQQAFLMCLVIHIYGFFGWCIAGCHTAQYKNLYGDLLSLIIHKVMLINTN